jgi:hypothetical protein
MIIVFLHELVSGQHGFFGVDHDNKFTAVCVRGKFGAVFASQDSCCLDGGFSEGNAGCVNNIPFSVFVKRFFFCHKSGHLSFPPFFDV